MCALKVPFRQWEHFWAK